MAENKIIDYSDPGIVVTETKITISDEKLSGLLSKAYEAALKDSKKFKIHNLWSVCWSISGTLLMAIITSSFNAIGSIKPETVTNWAIILCACFALVAIVLTVWRVNDKTSSETSERDLAVERIIKQHLTK